jgi:hypothetical protein
MLCQSLTQTKVLPGALKSCHNTTGQLYANLYPAVGMCTVIFLAMIFYRISSQNPLGNDAFVYLLLFGSLAPLVCFIHYLIIA